MGVLILISLLTTFALRLFATDPQRTIFSTITSELSDEPIGGQRYYANKAQAKANNFFTCNVKVTPTEFVYNGQEHHIADAWIEKSFPHPHWSHPSTKLQNYVLFFTLDKKEWGTNALKTPRLARLDQTEISKVDDEYYPRPVWQFIEYLSDEDFRSGNLNILFGTREYDAVHAIWKSKGPETQVTLSW